MVELLQTLACAANVVDTAKAHNSSEMRGLIEMPPMFFGSPFVHLGLVRILPLNPAGRNGERL
jgi:hypothetical protein